MNVAVKGNDERCVEVVASGLPLYHGVQLAVDIMRCSGERPGAAHGNEIVCTNARADKETEVLGTAHRKSV